MVTDYRSVINLQGVIVRTIKKNRFGVDYMRGDWIQFVVGGREKYLIDTENVE